MAKTKFGKHFNAYMDLTMELLRVRKEEPEREDEILDAMDEHWYKMSDEEMEYVNYFCSVIIGKRDDTKTSDGYI